MLKDPVNSIREVCQTLRVSKSTLYRYLNLKAAKAVKLSKQYKEKRG
jgi:predicted DNA-binding transcriptional regulator AlpA